MPIDSSEALNLNRKTPTCSSLRARATGRGFVVCMLYVLAAVFISTGCSPSKVPKTTPTDKTSPQPKTPSPKQAPSADPPARKHTTTPAWTVDAASPAFDLTINEQALWLKSRASAQQLNAAINLKPTLWISARLGANAPQSSNAVAPKPLAFGPATLTKQTNGSWQITANATHSTGKYSYVISGKPNAPTIELTLNVTTTRDVFIQEESLRFEYTGDTPDVLNSAYARVKPQRQHQINQHTPRRLTWMPFSMHAPDALGVRLNAAKKTFSLELDHRAHHPFKTYEDCPTTAALPSMWLDETLRKQHQKRQYRTTILLGQHPIPTPRRFPDGYLSAISLTDHADQNQASRSEAFAFGRTGAVKANETQSGFVNHGLNYTKTIFLEKKGGYAKQYDDPAFRGVLNAMKQQNIELGIHSVSGLSDTPARSLALLKTASHDYTFHTWIDHGPGTNCEAISNQGWNPSSPHYMLSVFAKTDLRTFWAVKDLVVPGWGLNMLAPTKKHNKLAVVYRHDRLRDRKATHAPTLFASAWFFGDRKGWLRRFSDRNLSKLEHQHGLLLAHTYLDTWRRAGKFAGRTLLQKTSTGHAIRPKFDALFENLAKRQARKKILTMGADRLSNHLLDAMSVRITPQPGGSFAVEHTGHLPLRGLTLRLPPEADSALIDGEAVLNTQRHREGLDIWFDLAPGQTHILRVKAKNKTTLKPFRGANLRIVIPTTPTP